MNIEDKFEFYEIFGLCFGRQKLKVLFFEINDFFEKFFSFLFRNIWSFFFAKFLDEIYFRVLVRTNACIVHFWFHNFELFHQEISPKNYQNFSIFSLDLLKIIGFIEQTNFIIEYYQFYYPNGPFVIPD